MARKISVVTLPLFRSSWEFNNLNLCSFSVQVLSVVCEREIYIKKIASLVVLYILDMYTNVTYYCIYTNVDGVVRTLHLIVHHLQPASEFFGESHDLWPFRVRVGHTSKFRLCVLRRVVWCVWLRLKNGFILVKYVKVTFWHTKKVSPKLSKWLCMKATVHQMIVYYCTKIIYLNV